MDVPRDFSELLALFNALRVDYLIVGAHAELFEEFQGFEEEVAGAIVPGALELQQDAAVPGEPEAILGDRRAQEVAAELLEPCPIFGWDGEVRVEIEALQMGLTGTGRGHPAN